MARGDDWAWLNHLHFRSACTQGRRLSRARRHRRLLLEPLEDRRLLAVVHWDGGPTGTGTDWNVAANSEGDDADGGSACGPRPPQAGL